MAGELSPEEIRVLGCLVEKETTTPEQYPLSTNGLVSACNQRSSRDPVVDYDDATVTAAMTRLRDRGLARTLRGEGSRVWKHAHLLGDALRCGPAELALLSVLMLRGPQTPGELRTRSERQHRFDLLDDLEETLEALASRAEPLVRRLPREPGRREERWLHLLVGDEAPATPASAPASEPAGADLDELRRQFAELRERVERLEDRLGGNAPADH